MNGLPVYRLEQEFHRSGVEISRQVMCNWVIRVAERYLSLVYDRMKRILPNQAVIQADETTVEVTKDGRKAGSKSYMWVYSTGEYDSSGKRVVLYDYRKTRATEHLKDFLGEYSGILVSDGYQSYHTLEKEKDGFLNIRMKRALLFLMNSCHGLNHCQVISASPRNKIFDYLYYDIKKA